jgi:hypothetical protein
MNKPTIKIDRVVVIWAPDEDGPSENNACCYARADVSYPISEKGDRRVQSFRSGGCYGIELTGPLDSYKHIVANDEMNDLREHLAVFNVPLNAFGKLASEALLK